MIVSKSIYFHKIRAKPAVPCAYISLDCIRDELSKLGLAISTLQKMMNKQMLPSFTSRDRRTHEICAQKKAIGKEISAIESKIKGFNLADQRITTAVQSYFFMMLKRIIIFYRGIQQECMRKSPVYNDYELGIAATAEECMLQQTIDRATHIRQTIFSLTNMLLELKIVLKNQTHTIDKIDFFFDQSNFYLDETNREIMKIPSRFGEFKDGIIYFLLYLICLLLILVLIRAAKKNGIL